MLKYIYRKMYILNAYIKVYILNVKDRLYCVHIKYFGSMKKSKYVDKLKRK